MQRLQQRRIRQHLRPDHRRGPNEPPRRHPRQSKPEQLRRDAQQDLEPALRREIVELDHCLDDLRRGSRAERHVGHDRDQCMLFDVEVSVRIPPAHGEPFCPCAADGEGEELGDQRADGDTGLAQTEELVETASYLSLFVSFVLSYRPTGSRLRRATHNGKNNTDCPHADGVHRKGHIIDGLHDGAHLGKRRVTRFVGENAPGIAIA